MSATILPFVPRHKSSRKPMLEQMALDVIKQVTVPVDTVHYHDTAPSEYVAPKDPA